MPWAGFGATSFGDTGPGPLPETDEHRAAEVNGLLSPAVTPSSSSRVDATAGQAGHPQQHRDQPARQAATHEVKTLPEYFSAIDRGEMPFDVRSSDRDFAAGDQLRLLEWDVARRMPTGRCLERRISCTLDLPGGLIVLGLERPTRTPQEPDLHATQRRTHGAPPPRVVDDLPVLTLPLLARIQPQAGGSGSELTFVDAAVRFRGVAESVWLIDESDAHQAIEQITSERDFWKHRASREPARL